ncbi:hypothetical protein QJS66_14490 [Kocuria rhizophila]|nr:hypothetical protein QJS66_14490 [Kocuria rhizophila]
MVAATAWGPRTWLATLHRRFPVRLHPAVGGRGRHHHEDRARGGSGAASLASGRTIFEGWRSLGRWTSWYSARTSSSGASCTEPPPCPRPRCPGGPVPVPAAVGVGHESWACWGLGSCGSDGTRSSRRSPAMVGIMFVVMVGLAVVAVPDIPEMMTG